MAFSSCISRQLPNLFTDIHLTCLNSNRETRQRQCLASIRKQQNAKRVVREGSCKLLKCKGVLGRSRGEIRAHSGEVANERNTEKAQGLNPSSNQHSQPSVSCQNTSPRLASHNDVQHKQFFRHFILFVLPLFLLTAFSSSAFALERPNNETLNTIIVPPGGGHMSVGQRIAVALRSLGLPDWLAILVVAALPVVELRGAIPVGYWLGLKPVHVYSLAVLGNMLPVPFVLAYVGRVSEWLVERSSLAKKFFDWLFARTRSRADLLVKYRTLGLTLFVAVPLPLTGAWSGAIGAHLLGLPFLESIAANLVGVMIAGVIVTVLCELGWTGAVIAGVGLFAAAIGAFWTSLQKKKAGEAPLV